LQKELTKLTIERTEKQRIADVYTARIRFVGEHAEVEVATRRIEQIDARIAEQERIKSRYSTLIETITTETIP
jgi:hypothetical protein